MSKPPVPIDTQVVLNCFKEGLLGGMYALARRCRDGVTNGIGHVWGDDFENVQVMNFSLLLQRRGLLAVQRRPRRDQRIEATIVGNTLVFAELLGVSVIVERPIRPSCGLVFTGSTLWVPTKSILREMPFPKDGGGRT